MELCMLVISVWDYVQSSEKILCFGSLYFFKRICILGWRQNGVSRSSHGRTERKLLGRCRVRSLTANPQVLLWPT